MNWRRSDFLPPRLLRGPHVQSVLSSSPLRAIRARRRLHAIEASHEAMVLDVGNGIRLQGVHSMRPGTEPRGLVVLLHGWEGSVDSNYMRLTAARLLDGSFAVFRLNFRDHGDSHHLTSGLLADPADGHRSVQTAGIGQDDALGHELLLLFLD